MKSENVSPKNRYNIGYLIIYKNEPLIRFLFFIKLTPISIGILFFCFISLTLTYAGAYTAPNPHVDNYVDYWKNVSWSLSILFIFPLVVVGERKENSNAYAWVTLEIDGRNLFSTQFKNWSIVSC